MPCPYARIELSVNSCVGTFILRNYLNVDKQVNFDKQEKGWEFRLYPFPYFSYVSIIHLHTPKFGEMRLV